MLWAGGTSVLWIAQGQGEAPVYSDVLQADCFPVFRCDDLPAVAGRLERAGAPVIHRDHDAQGNGEMYFLDPSGNVTGLVQRPRDSQRADDRLAFSSWDAESRHVDGLPPLGEGIHNLGWVVLRESSPRRISGFYEKQFGLEALDGEEGMYMIGDNTLIVTPGGSERILPTDRTEVENSFILRVDPIDPLIDDLKADGVHMVNELFDDGPSRLAYCVDPDHQLLGLQLRRPDSERPEDIEARRRAQK